MKTTVDFLDELRARHALASDGKLALHMGWQRAQLTRYRQRRETFSDQTALKVAAQLGIEPAYIMACMAWQRAKTPETRSAWERIAAKVAAVLVLGFAPGLFDSTQLSGAMGAESGPSTHMRQRRPGPLRSLQARLSVLLRTLALTLNLPGSPSCLYS